jgi:hypothetical protein
MLMGDHFNQRHFLDRAEEVQANHLPRSTGLRRNVADGSEEVLEAKIVCGPQCASISATIRCLRAKSSKTASITTSRWATPDNPWCRKSTPAGDPARWRADSGGEPAYPADPSCISAHG